MLLVHPSKAALALEVAQSVGLPPGSIFLFMNPNERLGEATRALKPWMDFWISVDKAKVWQWHRIRNIEEAKRTTAIINYSSGYVWFRTNAIGIELTCNVGQPELQKELSYRITT